ncbi:hypothetical protein L1987_61563 [Smallanthus sonchifolius]|uniref:Uncharacterized protein n=1 Tax=Smallanthus sonchifolius TaxID=185202 RepID=A0ACB9C832_9ASTR|nr:hypothetical protein L1987_61563 [Smallanthus sonchifolius]
MPLNSWSGNFRTIHRNVLMSKILFYVSKRNHKLRNWFVLEADIYREILQKLNCSSYIFAISISPQVRAVGIIYTVVWSAKLDRPVRDNVTLNFTAAGELVVKDGDGSMVWTTNTAGKSVVGMNLTDTGNLVLFDDRNTVVWQSFDYPTDCLLPGQKLFTGQQLKSTVSLTNSVEGMYSLQVTDKGVYGYVESNPPQAYYSLFDDLYGKDTNKGRRYMMHLNGSLSFFINSSNINASIIIPEASSAQYMKLMADGHLKVFEWQSRNWVMVADLTDYNVGECGYPLVCGRNSICSNNQQCSCPRKEYFRPVNDRQPNLGCSEITPLTCNSTQDQDFITLEKVKYFTYTADMEGVNMETCKQACLNNCSCKAAFFQYDSNASSGECFLPSEIFTMENGDTYAVNASAFIKVQNVTSPPLSNQGATVAGSTNHSSNRAARILGSTIGIFVLVVVVAIGFIMYRVHKHKRDAEMEEDYLDQVPGMPNRFSYEELKTATENFSKKLGEGGFGYVFEGSLPDASKIAVKRLEGLSHIKKSFIAEVQSIGSIHHVNLVRLMGFCTWKSQRFLVYDFMSNGSLDRWIYHGNREHILEWKCRKKIILDIAKDRMSSVVKVLEGGMNVESNLDYNFTDPRLPKNNSQEKDLTPLLPSVLSGPRMNSSSL